MLRSNATHQVDTVGAQQRRARQFVVHRFVEKNQSAVKRENLTPQKAVSVVVSVIGKKSIGLVPLSQGATLTVLMLRSNATHQVDTVGAQQRRARQFVVHRFVEKNQSAVKRENLTPLKAVSVVVSVIGKKSIGLVPLSQGATLTVLMLRSNATHQVDTVGAQ